MNRNLVFSVSETGILNGEVTLVIENAITATVSPETFSVVTSIASNPADYSALISVFPNPARDLVQIKSPVEITSITVYDFSARVVYKSIHNSSADLGHLQTGLYVMQIITVNDGYAMKKISIVK